MNKNRLKPQIRFAGFTEDWEQCKLGNITKSNSGGTPLVSNKEYYNGNVPFIRSGEISNETTEFYVSEKALSETSTKLIKRGDILYALYGATSGEVAVSRLDGAINQAVLAIIPQDNHSTYFISHWLRNRKDYIVDIYLQGGQGNLSGNIVKQLNIYLPNKREQKKIGILFQSLDNLITLHQRKQKSIKKRIKSTIKRRML
ncbi:MAG: restriction endonuclease subunit S [Dysgonamonadaceae bacterium]|nr:restriction endonuclease subunit S [Dysgonamonadaceae bacterium]